MTFFVVVYGSSKKDETNFFFRKKKESWFFSLDVHGAACGSVEAVDDGITSERGGADGFASSRLARPRRRAPLYRVIRVGRFGAFQTGERRVVLAAAAAVTSGIGAGTHARTGRRFTGTVTDLLSESQLLLLVVVVVVGFFDRFLFGKAGDNPGRRAGGFE